MSHYRFASFAQFLASTPKLILVGLWMAIGMGTASLTAMPFLPQDTEGKQTANTVVPLLHAHAHNDYHHQRPLHEALEAGFCSIEVDVYPQAGKLLVGHDTWELKPDRTLESLYLDPLKKIVQENQGQVYPKGPEVWLLVDIKNEGTQGYRLLTKTLQNYRSMISGIDQQGNYQSRAIRVVVSGDRDQQAILDSQGRWAGMDGRVTDLKSRAATDANAIPLISDRWGSHFRWNGVGEMPAAELEKLQSIVQQTHQQGRRLRFWATPEKPALWNVLRANGVDLIGTDQLNELKNFFSEPDAEK